MAAKKPLEIRGDEELERALLDAKEKIHDLSEPNREIASTLLNRARSEAPVLTGTLASSLFPYGGKRAALVGSALIYAAPIHFGWPAHGIEPNPFLMRARDAMVNEAVKRYEQELQALVDGVGNASKH